MTGKSAASWLQTPLKPNPVAESQDCEVRIDRLVCAIMLGVLTYDGDLLIVEPRKRS